MDEQTPIASFPVDLTREDMMEFQTSFSRVEGAMRRTRVLSVAALALAVLTGVFVILDTAETGYTDWLMIANAGLYLLVGILLPIIYSAMEKKRAATAYDNAVACGTDFVGRVDIYPDRVEKTVTGNGRVTAMPLDGKTRFIETPRLMAFVSAGRVALILPARCATEESAAAFRAAADRLPVQNRRFGGRLQPENQPVMPATVSEVPTLWEQTVEYSREEFYTLMVSTVRTRYIRSLPMLGLVSAAAGLTFGWDWVEEFSPLPCLVWFAVIFAVLTLMSLLIPRRRISSAAGQAPVSVRTLHILINSRGLHVDDGRGGNYAFPWSFVTHVYDRGDHAAFCDRARNILAMIPRRCVEDWDAFSRMLDEIRH